MMDTHVYDTVTGLPRCATGWFRKLWFAMLGFWSGPGSTCEKCNSTTN